MVPSLVHALVAAATLVLDVEPGVPCGLEVTLPRALEQHGFTVAPNGSAMRLEASVVGREVVVRLVDAERGVLARRALTITAADCPIFPKTVALLAKSWTSQRLAPEEPPVTAVSPTTALLAPQQLKAPHVAAPERTPAPRGATGKTTNNGARRPEPTPAPLHDELASPGHDTSSTESPRREASPGAPSTLVSAPEPSRRPEASVTIEPAPPVTEPTPAVPDEPPTVAGAAVLPSGEGSVSETPKNKGLRAPWGVSVTAIGGAAWWPGDQFVPLGALSVDWLFAHRFGVELVAGGEATRTGTHEGGTVEVGSQWLALSVRVVFHPTTWATLTTGLGPRGTRWGATSRGFLSNGSAVVWSGGAQAFAEGRATVVAGLFLSARVELVARIRSESFSIEGVGQVVWVLPWSGQLVAGAGWVF